MFPKRAFPALTLWFLGKWNNGACYASLCMLREAEPSPSTQAGLRDLSSSHVFQSCTDWPQADHSWITPCQTKISRNLCGPWKLCISLVFVIHCQVSCCACIIPTGANKTLPFWSGEILHRWWYIIQQRGRSHPLCISWCINRTRIKNLPIKLAKGNIKLVSQEYVKPFKLKPQRYVGLDLLFT